MADNSQKFIGRNRAPRVQIEYEVEHYGSMTKVQLPFVMGVLADLSGKLQTGEDGQPVPLPSLSDRKMLGIDVDNFDETLKSMKPRVSFQVPMNMRENSDAFKICESILPDSLIQADGISVDITFTSMDDFLPEAIVNKVKPLKDLLDLRKKLDNLITYMDVNDGADDWIANQLNNNPGLLDALTVAPKRLASVSVEAKE